MSPIICVRRTYGWFVKWDGFYGAESLLPHSIVTHTGTSSVEELPGETPSSVALKKRKNSGLKITVPLGVTFQDMNQFTPSRSKPESTKPRPILKSWETPQDYLQPETWSKREEKSNPRMSEPLFKSPWSITEFQVVSTTTLAKTSIQLSQKSTKKPTLSLETRAVKKLIKPTPMAKSCLKRVSHSEDPIIKNKFIFNLYLKTNGSFYKS